MWTGGEDSPRDLSSHLGGAESLAVAQVVRRPLEVFLYVQLSKVLPESGDTVPESPLSQHLRHFGRRPSVWSGYNETGDDALHPAGLGGPGSNC